MAKFKVLSLGHVPHNNPDTVKKFYEQFDVITTTAEERDRPIFLESLRTKRWGDFDAILRCFWYEGAEMGNFDEELVPLLPSSLKIHSSCGAGFDWMNIPMYTERGESILSFLSSLTRGSIFSLRVSSDTRLIWHLDRLFVLQRCIGARGSRGRYVTVPHPLRLPRADLRANHRAVGQRGRVA